MTNRQTVKAAVLNRVVPFLKDESGVMAPMILIFFFMMLLIGGIAVDVMRFEGKRVALQQTMDRAALAAASLENSLVPQDVVESYFIAAGVRDQLGDVDVVQTLNSRTVTVTAKVQSNNYFMSMMSVPYLQADNVSEAEQRITDIDIILVLDVSGSMAGTKLTKLKEAARSFVDQVKATDDENRISIGIVPYNAQVNLGEPLRAYYNATHKHGVANSNCLELPSSVFGSLELSRTIPLPMMAHADTETASVSGSSYVTPANGAPGNSAAKRWCNAGTNNVVTLPTKNPTKVKNAISNLTAEGNTSILLGMRWATALMDPSARPIYDGLIASNKMDADMTGRPLDYRDRERGSMKVIVLMTDGEHVAHNRVADDYKTDPADNLVYPSGNTTQIWRANNDKNYSVFHSSKVNTKNATTIKDSKPYYVPHLNAWHSRPWTGSTPKSTDKYSAGITEYNGATLQTWQDVWASVRVEYVARQFFQRPLALSDSSTNTLKSKIKTQYANKTQMDDRLKENCAAARAEGILVFGIAFQAPAAGKEAIQNCTTPPASTYYYDVTQTNEIKQAFEVIATNLSQLRLTQ